MKEIFELVLIKLLVVWMILETIIFFSIQCEVFCRIEEMFCMYII